MMLLTAVVWVLVLDFNWIMDVTNHRRSWSLRHRSTGTQVDIMLLHGLFPLIAQFCDTSVNSTLV